MSLIPLWVIHKSGQKPKDTDQSDAGWIFGLFLIGAWICGDYSYSFAIDHGWHQYAAYACGTVGAIVGGAIFAVLASLALAVGAVAIAVLIIVGVGYVLFGVAQMAFASHGNKAIEARKPYVSHATDNGEIVESTIRAKNSRRLIV